MNTNHSLLAILALSLQVPATRAEVNVAIVRLNDEGSNYLYASHKIRPADTVHFQFPTGGKPQCCAQVRASAASLLEADDDAVDDRSGQKLYRYRLPFKGTPGALPFAGIAAVGKGLGVEGAGPWKLKVRESGGTTELRLCTSREGVHVMDDRRGARQSDLYLFLAYDIDNPTCQAVRP